MTTRPPPAFFFFPPTRAATDKAKRKFRKCPADLEQSDSPRRRPPICPVMGTNRSRGNQRRPPAARPSAWHAALQVHAPTPAQPARHCDGCTACCTALIINDAQLVLAADARCPYECPTGCGIHGPGQPESCRTYFCGYTLSRQPLTRSDRPDHCGAIVDQRFNPGKAPPLRRTLHVIACAPDGLQRILHNRHWRGLIRDDLLAGVPVLAAQPNDPLNREVLGVRLQDGKLMCRLTSCHADGRPVLTSLKPVYQRPVEIALVIPEQGFVFDAQALISRLGSRLEVVLESSQKTTSEPLRFLFTRRQADWLRRLEALRGEPADATATNLAACNVR